MQWILPVAPLRKVAPAGKNVIPCGVGNGKEAVAHLTALQLRLRTREIAVDVFLQRQMSVITLRIHHEAS